MLDKLSGRMHAVQGGVWEGGEAVGEAPPGAASRSQTAEMKFPSVGEDPLPISTLPQFLWQRGASLGGKMPGDERCGEGLTIAAGAGGDRRPRGGEGEAWPRPAPPQAPGSIREGRGHRIRCGQTQGRMLGVSLGNNRILTAANHPGSICSEPHMEEGT